MKTMIGFPDDDYDSLGQSGKTFTYEEALDVIRRKLKYLRIDLGIDSKMEKELVKEMITAYSDKQISLMDLYAHFYAPCKITDPEFKIMGCGDMSDVMIDFSEGYEKFIKSLGDEYVNYMIRRRSAAILLSKIMTLPYPVSKIMYMRYFKEKSDLEIAANMFFSRATFYRLHKSGIDKLTAMYFPQFAQMSGKDDDSYDTEGSEESASPENSEE